MITRRDFLQIAAATAAATGLGGSCGASAAQQARSARRTCCAFTPKGQLTILHMADCHAQLKPLYFREPSINIGVGEARGALPHLDRSRAAGAFGIAPGSLQAYMLTSADYEALARTYGRVGGMDRMATLVEAIRAERGAERVLLLDGGDTLQGSYTALKSRGADMVDVMRRSASRPPPGTGSSRWARSACRELFGGVGQAGSAGIAFLAGNMRDTDFEEPVFACTRMFEKGGVSGRCDRPGVPLHADRQSALDDAATGRSAFARTDVRRLSSRRAPARGAGRGAAVAQRLRRRPQAGRAGRGHRCHPDCAYARCAAGAGAGRAHAADRLGLARQVPLAPRPGGGRRPRHRLRLRADPGAGRRHHARPGHGRPDRRASARRTRRCWPPSSRAPTALLLPARHFRRHARRSDLRRAAGRARRRDRPLAGLPLGRHAAAGPGHHLGGRLQRHRHHLSRRLPHAHAGREDQDILEDVADNLFHPDPY